MELWTYRNGRGPAISTMVHHRVLTRVSSLTRLVVARDVLEQTAMYYKIEASTILYYLAHNVLNTLQSNITLITMYSMLEAFNF